MKNKLDLNTYLTRYGQQGGEPSYNASQSRSKKFQESSYERMTYTPNNQPDVFQPQPVHYTGFSKSQNECIEQLQQIKRSLVNQERQLSFFLQNYSKKLHDSLLQEHNRIREQLLDMFDRAFSQSEKRISDIVARENGNEPMQFISIRKRIGQVNQKIDQLDQMLRGDNYRKAIAEVVLSDFEGEMRSMETLILNAQKSVLDNAVKLVMDQNAFGRLKEDIQNLVITDGNKRQTIPQQPQQHPPLGLGSSGVRKTSKQRLGLFDTAPQQMRESGQNSAGGFFNFNNN